MIKVDTVISHPKKIKKCINHVAYLLCFAEINIFLPEITIFCKTQTKITFLYIFANSFVFYHVHTSAKYTGGILCEPYVIDPDSRRIVEKIVIFLSNSYKMKIAILLFSSYFHPFSNLSDVLK